MPPKPYSWTDGAILGDHSKKKHKILQEYFSEYLRVRCTVPQQSRFRIAIVDAFSGGGKYQGGHKGSPIIFLETIKLLSNQINIKRAVDGMATITFECLLILNDEDGDAIVELKKNIAPFIQECKEADNLDVKIEFMNADFQANYEDIKTLLAHHNVKRNVFFNLDQCGSKNVSRQIITDILQTYRSSEVLLTFAIEAMMKRLPLEKTTTRDTILQTHGVDPKEVDELAGKLEKYEWRALTEKLIFESYKRCAPFVSPFAINNPDGWKYWLLHFASERKAREVYNDLLHDNSGVQAHYGRAGLNMLAYDPSTEGLDYLFESDDRKRALEQLIYDIPATISEYGDAVPLDEFLRSVVNETPAHSLDIRQAMIDSPDLIVKTMNGGERRSAKGIRSTDTIVMSPQRSFTFIPPLNFIKD